MITFQARGKLFIYVFDNAGTKYYRKPNKLNLYFAFNLFNFLFQLNRQLIVTLWACAIIYRNNSFYSTSLYKYIRLPRIPTVTFPYETNFLCLYNMTFTGYLAFGHEA